MLFLGLIVDSTSLCFFIPEQKKTCIQDQISRMLSYDFVPVRALASLYGCLISVYLATGPVIRLLTRFGFNMINSAGSWNQLVLGSFKCKKELFYIRTHLDSLEGHSFSRAQPATPMFSYFFASDASGSGLGTIELSADGGFTLVQQVAFSEEDMAMSSTY